MVQTLLLLPLGGGTTSPSRPQSMTGLWDCGTGVASFLTKPRGLVSGLGAGMQDPLAYYKAHKADIESVKNSVDLVQKITDSGKKKIRFGGDFALTYDPVSKLVFTVRIGGTF